MAQDKITLPIVNLAGEKVGTIDLDKAVFGLAEENTQAIHDAVLTQQANARQATAKTKKRNEVRGGGKKPWRQKGTGRARASSIRSPLWVGGGKVFGPDGNQSFKVSQNKQAHALALKTVLSAKAVKGLIVVDALTMAAISTQDFAKALTLIKAEGKTLVVTSDETLIKSARNLPSVTLRPLNSISVYDVLNAANLVIGAKDIATLEGGLQ